MKFRFLIVLLTLSLGGISQEADSIKMDVILKDDPVLAAIDSMMASGYFESLGFNDNPVELNTNGYAVDSVPVFDSLTYATRFEA